MADPTKYVPTFSFSGYQASNPSKPLPGPSVDNEFANVAASIGQTVDAIEDIRRADGKLQNGIVTTDSLSSDIVFAENPPEQWAPGQTYVPPQIVAYGNSFYRCLIAHTSTTFSADLAASRWEEVIRMQDAIDAADDAEASAVAAAASAVAAAAAAAAIGLPGTAVALNFIRQKADLSGFEYRTPLQVLGDIGAQAALGYVPASSVNQDFTGRVGLKKGANLTAATTVSLSTANYYEVDGSDAITAMTAQTVGTRVLLLFNGAPTLTHGANFIMPGGVDIATVAGAIAEFVSEGTGWRLINYRPPTRDVQVTATWTTGTGTTESPISPAKLKAAILALGQSFYTGSSNTNVTFPVGSYLSVISATDLNRNALIVPRLDVDTRDFTTGSGTVVTGTWRTRGRVSSGIYLAQRTA